MRLMHRITLIVTSLLPLTTALAQDPPANDQPPAQQPPAPEPTREELEKRFAETMSGAALVGHFTTSGREGQPREERYTITRVTKQQGDNWLFLSRMQFGGRDLTVPMIIPVKWAGDTAVISVTNLGIPGLGTYTARVVVYGDQYAGTWSGKDHGGHLWGRIERSADKEGESKPANSGRNRAPRNGPAAGRSGDRNSSNVEPRDQR